jgi:hypothetical protein
MRGRRRGLAARPLLARRHWATIAEASLALTASSVLTRLLPFHRYIGLGARGPAGENVGPDARDAARITDAIADRLPFRAVCLQRGLALQWMLRRRGIDAVLHYGIQLKNADEELAAHVWVSVGGEVLLGAPQHEHYAEVARFPDPKA